MRTNRNWAAFFTGKKYRFTQEEDFPNSSLRNFVTEIKRAAKRYSVKVTIHQNQDDNSVEFRCINPQDIITKIGDYRCPHCNGPIVSHIRSTHDRDRFICCKEHSFHPSKAISLKQFPQITEYDWESWCSGYSYRCYPGEDFTIPAEGFMELCQQKADELNLDLTIFHNEETGWVDLTMKKKRKPRKLKSSP